jgi:Icc-related predicted phosphoesterase
MKFTFISDTHTFEKKIQKHLIGGDTIVHCGDFMDTGRDLSQLKQFLKWFNGLKNYQDKILIAGNHDRLFQDYDEETVFELVSEYEDIIYLQDSGIKYVEGKDIVNIWGSPWQPEFNGWAFNLPRGGYELEKVWNKIPKNTDLLITHGPPQGILDTSGEPYNKNLLGCNLLAKRVKEVKPKIHVFGHIHGSHGYKFDGHTHYINASMLNERYEVAYKPIHIDWNPVSNEITFNNV